MQGASVPMDDKFKRFLRNPNNLTLFRIIAVPVIVLLMIYPNRLFTALAALIFSAAAITDYLDGHLARQYGLESTLGKVMDPVADKLLVSSAFIMITSHGWIPAWMVCIIVGRELAVTGLRNIIAGEGEDVSASWLGSTKPVFKSRPSSPCCFTIHTWGSTCTPSAPFFSSVRWSSRFGPVSTTSSAFASCSIFELFC